MNTGTSKKIRRLLAGGAALLVIAAIPVLGLMGGERTELRVAAAADLGRAFRELAPLFERESGAKVSLIFGSTGLLSKQAENGAPFDVLAAANEKYISDLASKGKIAHGTRSLYAIGRLVIWTRPGQARVKSLKELAGGRFRKVAIANPLHAPYGRTAREALENEGVWASVEPKLIYGENVMQAMQYAQSGNADAAIVALSLAVGSDGLYSVVPESLHLPLRQAAGVLASSRNIPLARRFTAFINGPAGRPIMRKYGFVLPGERVK